MSGKTEISQQPRRKGWKHQVIVHLLKVTRLPTDLSSPGIDITPHHTVRKNTLKVTVLYDSLQIPLGDFPMLMNECVINQRLACQFCVSKPETQAKLYLYIDQAYSSGLTGHLALDLHEFVREDDSEVYVKYPLYANTSNQCRGPAVKILIRYLGVKKVKPFADEENDIFLLPHQRIEELQKSRVCSTEDDAISLHDSCSSLVCCHIFVIHCR
ncbi:hypothetical protein KP509_01G108200 [Ceratopteris richardii]|uniref:Uncharacterized protein n=1 Tax=Ceratopteris richardii TaxID=49495 RepID=A0A8T2VSS4_CERRI|nr:hypothetical protein KP509_01G108200 [Ceratopteris richardii]